MATAARWSAQGWALESFSKIRASATAPRNPGPLPCPCLAPALMAFPALAETLAPLPVAPLPANSHQSSLVPSSDSVVSLRLLPLGGGLGLCRQSSPSTSRCPARTLSSVFACYLSVADLDFVVNLRPAPLGAQLGLCRQSSPATSRWRTRTLSSIFAQHLPAPSSDSVVSLRTPPPWQARILSLPVLGRASP